MSWQPIKTAPKDGTVFLAATFHAGRWHQLVMWWDDAFETLDWDDELEDFAKRGAWTAGRVGSWNYQEYAEEEPTHWMPLPSPPTPGDPQ